MSGSQRDSLGKPRIDLATTGSYNAATYQLTDEMIAVVTARLSRRILELESINADLLAACEANLEFQTGFHDCIGDIMELAEKCRRLTESAVAKARGAT